MALKALLNDLDGLSPEIAALYDEKDGGFVLAIEGLDQHPGAAALKAALDRVRGERRALSDKLTVAESRLDGLPDDFDAAEYERLKATDSGEAPKIDERLERQRADLEKKHAAEKAKLDGRIAKLDGTLRKTLVDEGLTKALIEAGVSKDFLPAAKALLKERGAVKLIEEDDEFQVLADNGIDDRMPLPKFVADWASDEGKHFIAKPTGGDAKGGDAKRFADNPFAKDSFNRTKQAELIDANPGKARQMAEAAGVRPNW